MSGGPVGDVVVPRINANDDTYTVIDWLFSDGDEVPEGAVVVVVETSKATEDILCESGGILHRVVDEFGECAPGDVIGHVFADDADRLRFVDAVRGGAPGAEDGSPAGAAGPAVETLPAPADEVTITKPARSRAAELGIPLARLRTLGKAFVRAADVESLVGVAADVEEPPGRRPEDEPPAAAGTTLEIPRVQRLVSSVVSRSNQEVPTGYALLRVEVDRALALTRRLTSEHREMIGLPELLVVALAALRPAHPLFFARRLDDRRAWVEDGAHVGVTVDVGTGLFVPVMRDAHQLNVVEVAQQLEAFRRRARTSSFRPKDLVGGSIMLSLHCEPDVVMAAPIVHPGQTCVVTLPGAQQWPVATVDGLGVRTVVHLGVSYDHRLVNGREAVAFGTGVKALLEDPETLCGA